MLATTLKALGLLKGRGAAKSLVRLCHAERLVGGLSVSLRATPDEVIGALAHALGGAATKLKLLDVRTTTPPVLEVQWREVHEQWEVDGLDALVHNLNDLFRDEPDVKVAVVLAESRLRKLEDGRYEYSPKKGVAFILTAEALVKRLVALSPPPNRHLTSFHGVYAPNAKLRPLVVTPRAPPPAVESPPPPPPPGRKTTPPPPPRLDWASLHQRTFGTDVLQCPCGGRRTVRRVHLTRKAAEARLVELGVALPSRLLPRPTAPPQLVLDVE